MSPHSHSPSVLVLDPIDDERDMYAEYLRATGFKVCAHPHADDASTAIDAARPDVVVVRLLPAPSDDSATHIVRRLKRRTSTPVVVIASSSRASDKQAAVDAQCDSYLLLPVMPDALAAEINRLMQIARHSDPC